LLRLRDGDRGRYQRIVRRVNQVAPFFRDFVLQPELAPDRVRLRWQQEGEPGLRRRERAGRQCVGGQYHRRRAVR
jgi:hypothetical protein